jgi:hypothetical protein
MFRYTCIACLMLFFKEYLKHAVQRKIKRDEVHRLTYCFADQRLGY